MERSPSASGLWTWRIFKDRTEGVLNKPPQGVPLWPVDYFEPKALEKQKMQKTEQRNRIQ